MFERAKTSLGRAVWRKLPKGYCELRFGPYSLGFGNPQVPMIAPYIPWAKNSDRHFFLIQLEVRALHEILSTALRGPFLGTFEELNRYFKRLAVPALAPMAAYGFPPGLLLCLLKQRVLVSEPYPKKSGSINEVSDPEDELTDSQKTSKLSEIYSTTIPSVDSAMESWDGSGIDAGYGSQGKPGLSFLEGPWAKAKIRRASKPVWRRNMSQSLWSDHVCMASCLQQGTKCILRCTHVVLGVGVCVLGFYWRITSGLYSVILFTTFSKPLQYFIIHIIRGNINSPYVLQSP